MRFLLQPWFLIVFFLFLLHQFLQKLWHIPLPLLDAYLDPLLLMPLLFHLRRWEKKQFQPSRTYAPLSKAEMLSWFLLASILAEYFFPRWSKAFTADAWDILLYSLGALLYARFWNSPFPA